MTKIITPTKRITPIILPAVVTSESEPPESPVLPGAVVLSGVIVPVVVGVVVAGRSVGSGVVVGVSEIGVAVPFAEV